MKGTKVQSKQPIHSMSKASLIPLKIIHCPMLRTSRLSFSIYTQKQFKLSETAVQSVCRFSFEDVFEGPDNETNDSWTLAQCASKRRQPLYSESCPYGFNCKFGVKCNYQHSEKELGFFHTNKGRGNPLRKVKPCFRFPNCPKKAEDYQYAHGEEDAFCQFCIDYVGHYTENCPTYID